MENGNLYDLIERYLDDNLSETERISVESRLVDDPEFREEVALHKALHRHLSDSGELRLRSVLTQVLTRPVADRRSPAPPRKRWLIALGIVLLVMSALIALLWTRQADTFRAPRPVMPQEGVNPDIKPEQNQAPAPVPPNNGRAPLHQRPIAKADTADFKINPSLEARLGNYRGVNDALPYLSVTGFSSKLPMTSKDKQSGFYFQGLLDADTLQVRQPFWLFIYSNRPADWKEKASLYAFPLQLQPAGPDQYKIDLKQKIFVGPGLYYLVVGWQINTASKDSYATLWVGKMSMEIE